MLNNSTSSSASVTVSVFEVKNVDPRCVVKGSKADFRVQSLIALSISLWVGLCSIPLYVEIKVGDEKELKIKVKQKGVQSNGDNIDAVIISVVSRDVTGCHVIKSFCVYMLSLSDTTLSMESNGNRGP